jgi:FkbM family methyltransferase
MAMKSLLEKLQDLEPRAKDYEALVQETYEAVLREGDIAIDVGAHKGRHCLAMAEQVYPTGKVLAFEPLPMCRAAITQEIDNYFPELANALTIYPYALSDFTGKTEFIVAKDALAYSGLKERKYDWPTELERIPIEVKRLDDLCLDLPSLRYVKIDAEGGEYHILKGAVGCLRKFRPVVVFEFGTNAIDQYRMTPAEMARFWVEQGYKVYDIVGNHLPEEIFIQSAHSQRIWDYVAVPAENATLENHLVRVLTRPPSWHRVTTHLDAAEHSGHVGAGVPRLVGFRGWKRRLARWAAGLVIYGTQVITRPQRTCNRCLVRALRGLVKILRARDKEAARQAARVAACEGSIDTLGRRLASLEQEYRDRLNHLTCALSERDVRIKELETLLNQFRESLSDGDANRAA